MAVAPAPDQAVLFDGFPRTITQAQFLDDLLDTMGRTLDAAVYVNVSGTEIMRRLAGRLICRIPNSVPPAAPTARPRRLLRPVRRRARAAPDDIPELIRVRLRAFQRVTAPLVDTTSRRAGSFD